MKGHTPARLLSTSSRRTPIVALRYQSTTSSTSTNSQSANTSSSSSTPWSPLLPPGQHKAYDEALTYLHTLRDDLLSKLSALKALPNPTARQLRKIESLEVEAHVNDPSTRHTFRETRGAGMMDRPVFRHLAERRWKKEGGLDLIMGRVYQNKVVPDVIPDLAPTSPLTIKIKEGTIEPGLVLEPSKFENPPHITWQGFQHPSHPSNLSDTPSAMYTLLTIDPDVPNARDHTFSERITSLKVDIPLSVIDGQLDLLTCQRGKEIFSWEPPAPPKGTSKHRYITLLIRQSPSFTSPHITSRESFNTRDFLKSSNVDESAIQGVTLFRSEWTKEEDAYINKIWREVRGRELGAPVFKRGPKEDRYGYPLTALQRRALEVRHKAFERAIEEMGGIKVVSGLEAMEAMDTVNKGMLEEDGMEEEDEDDDKHMA